MKWPNRAKHPYGYIGSTFVGASGTDGPFSKDEEGHIFLLSSSGGGLPGRPVTRKSPDARFILGLYPAQPWLTPSAGTYP
jgi:hypothetical protein